MILSVVMITYCHEKFIRDSINSILMQKTSFKFELIISNDCSPDDTHNVISDIIASHPNSDIIKYTRHNKNLGLAKNTIWSLNQAKGKYVALCEGDDYWIDSEKLQRQVDFLEENADYSFCFHPVYIKNETDNSFYSYPIPSRNILIFRDILFKHYIPTCSLVFRNDSIPKPLPRWFEKCKMCDIPLELFLADKGNAFYMHQKMGVYRFNQGGITQDKEHIKNGRKSYDFLYKSLRQHFGSKYYFLFTLMILKNKLGKIKDFLGLNPIIKNNI
jgi:glycosyltransferase involved in cell wall biosynthesis